MRIIAGRFKGRTLRGPTSSGVRPTSDGLRETLFNVIGPRVSGARVLDGFAGTGAIGLEALSRGAATATFVERDRRTVTVLSRNVEACGAAEMVEIIARDFSQAAAGRDVSGPFDLVILDPPYELPDIEAVLATAGALVADGGLLVLEHSRRRAVPEMAGRLRRHRVITAGDSALSFYASAAPADTMGADTL